MKLIINIPEETVNEIKDNTMFAGSISSEIRWDITSAIVNGISLDKIRTEIEEERKGYPPSADEYKTINKVLQIIDKYRKGE